MSFAAWNFSQTHTITHSTTLTDYQVKFTVYKTTGSSTGSTLYCNNNCNDDFSDLRFTVDDATSLSYWIESYTSGVTAAIWVKLPSILTTIVKIYYGNAFATSESSGANTFVIFDDFTGVALDAAKWTTSTGIVSVAGGSVTCTNNSLSASQGIKSASTFSAGSAILTKFSTSPNSTTSYPEVGFDAWGTNGITITASVSNFIGTAYDGTQSTTTVASRDTSSHLFEIQWISNSLCKYNIDNGSFQSITTHIPVTAIPLTIRPYSTNASYYVSIICDYIAVRLIDATDPAHSTWTAEFSSAIPLSINASPSSGVAPLVTTVSTIIRSPIDSISILYGDGDTYSSSAEPIESFTLSHTYDTFGNYLIYAIGTKDAAIYEAYSIVSVIKATLDTQFTYSQNENIITFTDTSTGTPNEWYWTFGDGVHSFEQNPVHHYTETGTYTVTFYSSNQYSYDQTSSSVTITSIIYEHAPIANFIPGYFNSTATPPVIVQFTNLSYEADTYLWDFGDSSFSTLSDPAHSFATRGTYDVSLTATNPYGSDTKTYYECVKIHYRTKYLTDDININETRDEIQSRIFRDTVNAADNFISAKFLQDSITAIQKQILESPGMDEYTHRNLYSTVNEWGHAIIGTLTEYGGRLIKLATYSDKSGFRIMRSKKFTDEIVIEENIETDV